MEIRLRRYIFNLFGLNSQPLAALPYVAGPTQEQFATYPATCGGDGLFIKEPGQFYLKNSSLLSAEGKTAGVDKLLRNVYISLIQDTTEQKVLEACKDEFLMKDGNENRVDTKALELALDRWVNEGGYFLKFAESGALPSKQGGFVRSESSTIYHFPFVKARPNRNETN